ncbi:MAG: HAMP domain-containing histidine kinase, partial [Firmicutes bacterium]|nr:HAMP domain-containing histidine kinase [Bacillota bacterium]
IEWRSFPAGNVIHAAARDIDERKKAEEMLLDKNRELNDFAYRVSHDLKNPVNIINGYVELLDQEPEMLVEFIPRIKEQNQKMLSFIDSLLKLSRAGRAIDCKIDIEIINILNSVETEFRNAGIKAELNYDIQQKNIWGDLDSIYLLIRNIFENSIKYSDPKKEKTIIDVVVTKKDNYTVISVTDNGIGISEENFDKIFKPGITLDKKKGTGFGLAIAKRIVTAHGGSISVESKGEFQGTTFIICLPLP